MQSPSASDQNPYKSPQSAPEPLDDSPPGPGMPAADSISALGKKWVLVAVFLGWFFAGTQLSITSLVVRPASISLLNATGQIDSSLVSQQPKDVISTEKQEFDRQSKIVGLWVTWQTCAFLFGAASGGLVLGWVGDRFGRSKGMAASIICYSLLTLLGYWAETPTQLLILRYFASLGVGGMWPNGVALAAEVCPHISRPLLSGIIGTAANIAIALVSFLAMFLKITPDDWRWTMVWFGMPLGLGILAWLTVAESPRWLAEQSGGRPHVPLKKSGMGDAFRPPILRITLIGIMIGSVPIFGGWGCANWSNQWADKVGALADPHLKAQVLLARSFPGMISSFLGGWMASLFGRRKSYAICSVAALLTAQTTFWFFTPADTVAFLWLTGILGFFSGLFFGWLPMCLPEMFPTRVRSTGAGVSFNFGRVVTAVGVLATSVLVAVAGEDYAVVGRVTSLIYLVGAIVIWFAPLKESDELPD